MYHARSSIHMHVCSNAVNHTSEMADALQGEFCYVQTSDGKIVSVHYGTTENDEAINIKRSIATSRLTLTETKVMLKRLTLALSILHTTGMF